MKHRLFESWILDNPPITEAEQQQLSKHLKVCPQCQKLQTTWLESRNQMKAAKVYEPQPGFSLRWRTLLSKRLELEKVRQVRKTLLILTLLLVMASLFYMLQNNLLITWIVSAVSLFASLFISVTKALVGIGELLSDAPALYYGFGFLSLGVVAAFLATSAFLLWNVLKNGSQKHADNAED